MKTIDNIRNEKGFILVLALVVMAAMTAIGLAIITSSTTDMLISRNETEARKAFYLAEAGMQEALGRMSLTGNARYVGENSAQKVARINNLDMPGGSGMYAGQAFTSADLSSQAPNPLQNLNGTYTVTVNYALADPSGNNWCQSTATPTYPASYPAGSFTNCGGQVILFGQDFGFQGTGIPYKGFVPVFQIDSTGTTASGTSATVREYVTSSTLNVIPPAGNVFANTTSNPSIDIGGSGNITGNISGDFIGGGCTAPACSSVPWPGSVDMTNYLGIPTYPDLMSYASPPSPYSQTGNNAVTYDTSGWGTACNSTDTGTNVSAHICDNPASIIYINNQPNTSVGPAKVLGGSGRGILVVTGDFEVAGNFVWEGLVYIMGNLKGNGTIVCYGDIMANGTIGFNGNVEDYGSDAVASSVAEAIAIPRELRWSRR